MRSHRLSHLFAGLSLATLCGLTAACAPMDSDDPAAEATEGALLARTALAPKPTFALLSAKRPAALIGRTAIFAADSGGDDTGGGDTGGGGDSGGGSGGSTGGGGTQCSDQSEGDQCTECQVNGQTCECCGWTECWEEDDVCICALEVEDVDCTGGDAPTGGGGFGPAQTQTSGF